MGVHGAGLTGHHRRNTQFGSCLDFRCQRVRPQRWISVVSVTGGSTVAVSSCIAELLKEFQTLIGIKALLPNEGLRSVRLMK